ncbi:protein N-terminal asparagine amidohydrolase-like [Amphiura filiformis]|uniref:protein N-terminal asparagine amidohydrolase-like n=1 Tax=Amphiura filiformis TaxID=82378 RepID=UPI003B221B36
MPLLVNDKSLDCIVGCNEREVKPSGLDLNAVYPHFKESSTQLFSKSPQKCQLAGVLYVCQREYAVTTPQDSVVDVIGSEDATTCHVAVLRHTGCGVTGLAHFDGCSTSQGVTDLISRVGDLSQSSKEGRLELHLVGGFSDDQKHSEKLSKELLCEFHRQASPVHLKTACITDVNTIVKDNANWPRLYGIGVNVKSGEIFPAIFEDKGPDQALRGLRNFIGDQDMLNVYNHETGELRIGPFSYQKWPHAALILAQPDAFIRKNLSTSPEVEPPYFENHVRQALTFYLQNPDPAKTVFPQQRSHVYKRNAEGRWEAAGKK